MTPQEKKQKLLSDFQVAQSNREQVVIDYNTELNNKATKEDIKLLEATQATLQNDISSKIGTVEANNKSSTDNVVALINTHRRETTREIYSNKIHKIDGEWL